MQGCGWPATRIGERVGDGVALSHTRNTPVPRTEKRGLSRREAETAERRFGFIETQLAGMLPRIHRRSRLRGFSLRMGTPKNRTIKKSREYGASL